jgi:hypothetical protein
MSLSLLEETQHRAQQRDNGVLHHIALMRLLCYTAWA